MECIDHVNACIVTDDALQNIWQKNSQEIARKRTVPIFLERSIMLKCVNSLIA